MVVVCRRTGVLGRNWWGAEGGTGDFEDDDVMGSETGLEVRTVSPFIKINSFIFSYYYPQDSGAEYQFTKKKFFLGRPNGQKKTVKNIAIYRRFIDKFGLF